MHSRTDHGIPGRLSRALAHLLALVLLVPALVTLAATPAAAENWAVDGETTPSTFACDKLFYSNYRSGMQFGNGTDGRAEIQNTVVSKRAGTGLPDYWSANMAAGTDPDTGTPALFYSDYRSGNTKLYKQVSGTGQVTDEIYGGQTRNLPSGTNWGGLGYDSTRGKLYAAVNLSSLQLAQVDLKTGQSKVWTNAQLRATAPNDPVIQYGTTIPDLFVDKDGGAYFGMSYGGTYIYRLDPDTGSVTRVTQITGPGAIGTNAYGIAFHDGAIYLGGYDGQLYRADPRTGASTQVPGGTAQANQVGRIQSEGGGTWPITDLASCSTSPNLTKNITVRKTSTPTSAKPGDTVTYTVTAKNEGTSTATGVSLSDDLSGVVDDARYNDDARTTTDGSATSTQPSYDSGTGELSWTGDIGAGKTVTLTYTVKVGTPPGGDKRLGNTVTAPDSNCAEGSTEADCSTTVPVAALRLKKTSAPASPMAGDTVTYTVTAENTGTATWSNARITDDLTDVVDDARYNDDARTTTDGSATSTQPSYDSGTGELSWTGDIGAGKTVTLTYTVKVGDPPAGNKRLTNKVVGPDGSNCPEGSTDPDCSDSTSVKGLKIKKAVSQTDAKPGDTLTYTLTAENVGGDTLTGVRLSDDLSGVVDDARYNDDARTTTDGSATSTQPSYDSGTGKLSWTGDIGAGKTVTLTYTVKVGSPPQGDKILKNAVTGPGESNCPSGATSADCGTTTPVGLLDITKTADPTEAKPGSRITYTVTVKNVGEGPYPGASFTDDLSGVLDDATWDDEVTKSAGTTSYDAQDKRLTWRGDLAKGDTVTVQYTVTVGKPPRGDQILKNAVTGPDGSNCAAGTDDADCESTVPVKSLRIEKKASPANPRTGDTVTYTVTVQNTGATDYAGATFTDDLSDVLDDATWNDDLTASEGQARFDAPGSRVTWTGDLAKGATATVTYTVTVTLDGDKYLRNVVTADGSNCEEDSTDPDCRKVLPQPPLEIVKTASPATAKPDDTVTYTVKVTNRSTTADYENASFTDDLSGVLDDATWSDEVTKDSGTTSFDADAKTFTWRGSVAKDSTVTLTYKVKVGTPPQGDKKLSNSVVGPDDSTCPEDSQDPGCSSVTPIGQLRMAKKSSPSDPQPGDTVTYTVTVENTGEGTYRDATFSDDLSGVLDDATWGDTLSADMGDADFDPGTERVTWTGDLDKGDKATISYTVTVGTPPQGDKVLQNAVTGPDGSNCATGSDDPDCGSRTPLGTLVLKKTATPATAKPGDTVNYTVTAHNPGKATYKNARFVDDLSDVLKNADYNGDERASGGTVTYRDQKVRWNYDLPAGETVTITYSVTLKKSATGGDSVKNVLVGPDDSTCPPDSDDPDCTSVVPLASLEITKRATPQKPKPGDKVTYTLTLTNTGNATYRDARVEDDLTGILDDATYGDDARADSGTLRYDRPHLVWTGDVRPGSPVTIVYSVTVDSPPQGDKRLKNSVTSTADTNCGEGSTDPDCAVDAPVPSLHISKKATPQDVKTGDTLTYTVTVENTGETRYDGATFTDDLSGVLDDATWNGDETADKGRASFDSPRLTWRGDLDAGETATITYSVTVTNKGDESLHNAVTGEGSNCVAGSGDPDCTSVLPAPRVEIRKTARPDKAVPGGQVTYEVTLRNTGKGNARDVSFTDDLTGVLDDATYDDNARADGGTVRYDEPRLTWRGDIPAGQTFTVRYSVTVGSPPEGDMRLKNAVTSPDDTNCPKPTPASVPRSRAARAPVDPHCGSETPIQSMRLHKRVSPRPTIRPGDTATYTLTATNTGTATIDPATFTDDLSGILDDATWDGDARASRGTVTREGDRLEWRGALPPGATATVTYTVTVADPPRGDRILHNAVTSTTPGSGCALGTEKGCTTSVEVTTSTRPNPTPLPNTGNSALWWAAGAAALLLGVGARLYLVARRRRG